MKVPIFTFHQTEKHLSKSLYIWCIGWNGEILPQNPWEYPQNNPESSGHQWASTIQQRAQLLIDPDRIRCRAEIRNMEAPQMIRRFNDLGFCTKLRQCIRSRNHWDNQDIFGSYPVVACVGRGNWMWVFVMVLYLHMMVQLFNRQTRLNHHFLQRKSEDMSPFKSSFWFK